MLSDLRLFITGTENMPQRMWTWGHEGNAAGMRNSNMCGPFFDRNLSGIIHWMMGETSADLNAWNRRVQIGNERDGSRWASLRDLALRAACQHSGTWPHHFPIVHVDPHNGDDRYCQRCGMSEMMDGAVLETFTCTKGELFQGFQYDRANDVPC